MLRRSSQRHERAGAGAGMKLGGETFMRPAMGGKGGHRDLLVAPDGERAWEMAVQEPAPDLVLSDVEMPGLGGIELTRRLRAQAHTATVPILLFSANNRLPTLLEGLDVGADDFLLKPFRPTELLARLRSRHHLCEMRRAAIVRQCAERAAA